MDVPEIDIEAFAAEVADGANVVDVRGADEYEDGHVPGAQLVPLDELVDRVSELPDDPLLMICKSGGRSLRAAEFLAAQGRSVTNVSGGTMAWIDSGRAVVQGSSPT